MCEGRWRLLALARAVAVAVAAAGMAVVTGTLETAAATRAMVAAGTLAALVMAAKGDSIRRFSRGRQPRQAGQLPAAAAGRHSRAAAAAVAAAAEAGHRSPRASRSFREVRMHRLLAPQVAIQGSKPHRHLPSFHGNHDGINLGRQKKAPPGPVLLLYLCWLCTICTLAGLPICTLLHSHQLAGLPTGGPAAEGHVSVADDEEDIRPLTGAEAKLAKLRRDLSSAKRKTWELLDIDPNTA
jgi:hypothetical protein